MISTYLLLVGTALVTGFPQEGQLRGDAHNDYFCPEPFGTFEDEYQCDKYWVCENDIAKPVICEDGLVFDVNKGNAGIADPCESPFVIDCGTRTELQLPSHPSTECPRSHGIFASEDRTDCGKFYTCIRGKGTPTECTDGLHFDERSGICQWPTAAGRTGCALVTTKCLGDFCCNGTMQITHAGVENPHPVYPHETDCQKFYVCESTHTPKISSCNLGLVFSGTTFRCESPKLVPECDGWYEGVRELSHLYDDYGSNNRNDVGNQDTVG